MNQMIELSQISQLAEIDSQSALEPVIIFKHSTSCSISSAALSRFQKAYANLNSIKVYYLDLIKHRDVSNEIARHYKVEHQSPQSLLIKNGQCKHHASHFEIDLKEILEAVA